MWSVSDEALVAGLAAGDGGAATAFVRRFQARVFGLALTMVGDAAVAEEIARANALIRRVTGQDTHPLFRFPYGDRDARTLTICHGLGYASIRWTVDTWGWMGAPRQSVPGAVRRVVDSLVPGEIVLMHVGSSRDGSTIDTKALPRVIRAVRARGYRFVTLKGIRPPPR
jgi:peptidoglycan/xylan/chitin deacetylase (PgdA/CDA1 family)